jgi:glutaconate CoA-transferase subunit A
LVAAGCLQRVEYPFGAISVAGRVRSMPYLKRAIESAAIEWVEHEGYRVVQRLRAAGMGLPFIPAPDIDACELSSLDPPRYAEDPFTGQKVPVEQAFSPDVALIHAQAADEQGNLFIEDPTTDLLIANASKRVLATAETRVRRLDRVTLPGFQVEMVAEAAGGALPTGCYGAYEYDEAALLSYLELAEAGRAREWLEQRLSRRAVAA